MFRAPREEALQRVGGDACFAELPGRAGGRRKTLYGVPILFGTWRIAARVVVFPEPALPCNPWILIAGREYLFDRFPLGVIQVARELP